MTDTKHKMSLPQHIVLTGAEPMVMQCWFCQQGRASARTIQSSGSPSPATLRSLPPSLEERDLFLHFPGISPTPWVSRSHGGLIIYHILLTFDCHPPSMWGGHLWGCPSLPHAETHTALHEQKESPRWEAPWCDGLVTGPALGRSLSPRKGTHLLENLTGSEAAQITKWETGPIPTTNLSQQQIL